MDQEENQNSKSGYRFQGFSRQQLLLELAERKKYPWKIHQRGTSLCGIACLFYLLARENPVAYEQLVLDLHEFGQASYQGYLIKPTASMLKIDPLRDASYPPQMANSDWIALASVRNVESRLGYTGKISQVFPSINWPPMMIKLARTFLGFNTVEFKVYSLVKSYLRDYLTPNHKLEILRDQIDKSYQEGFKILLLIDSGMLRNKESYAFKDYVSYHWVVYEGGLEFLNESGNEESDFNKVEKLRFDTFTWGEDPKYSRTSNGISKKAFIRNYYGFIRLR